MEEAVVIVSYRAAPGKDVGPHMQQPHLRSFIERAGSFLAGPPDISFWHACGA
jgi:quinol monooxygenase YgiN